MASGNITVNVKLDEQDVEAIVQRVAARLGQGQWPQQASVATGGNAQESYPPVTSAPEPQAAHGGQVPQEGPYPSQEPADPWTGQAPQSAPYAGPAPAQGAPVQHSAPTASPVVSAPQRAAQGPSCVHGPMIYRQGGIAKSGPRAGQPYPPFYACSTPRNAPDKCRSVSA